MTDAERRRKSDELKRSRGEYRVTTWISAEAYEAMLALTGGKVTRGSVQEIINYALIITAKGEKKGKK